MSNDFREGVGIQPGPIAVVDKQRLRPVWGVIAVLAVFHVCSTVWLFLATLIVVVFQLFPALGTGQWIASYAIFFLPVFALALTAWRAAQWLSGRKAGFVVLILCLAFCFIFAAGGVSVKY